MEMTVNLEMVVRILSVNLLGNCNSFFKTHSYQLISSLSPGAPLLLLLKLSTGRFKLFSKYSCRNFNNLGIVFIECLRLLTNVKLCNRCACRLYVTCTYQNFRHFNQNKINQHVFCGGNYYYGQIQWRVD